MFKTIENEPKDIKDLIQKILGYHFDTVFTEPLTQNAKNKQVISWIESASKQNLIFLLNLLVLVKPAACSL